VKVLERGYALVQDEHGRLLRRASEAAPGQSLRVRLHEGRLGVEVRDIE
jgi:exodeoxyribonuclease VII large subunit